MALLAVLGGLFISACSAKEQRPATNRPASGRIAENAAAAEAVPSAPQELWNGLYAGMSIEEATAKANDIFQAGKITDTTGRYDSESIWVGSYLVNIYTKTKKLTAHGDFNNVGGITESIPYENEITRIVMSECVSPLYDGANLRFSQGLLFSVTVRWKSNFQPEEIYDALVNQYGQPGKKKNLSSSHIYFAWDTNSKYIFFNNAGEEQCIFTDRQWFSSILAVIDKQKQDEAAAAKERSTKIEL
jgi:hypothetical protein